MKDGIRDEYVRKGRDPDWRLAWEEHLSDEARRKVEAALKQPRRIEEPALLPYVQGLGQRRLRYLSWSVALAPLHVALVGLWIWATCFVADPPQAWCWFYVALGIVWLFLVPVFVVRRRRRLKEAVDVNRSPTA